MNKKEKHFTALCELTTERAKSHWASLGRACNDEMSRFFVSITAPILASFMAEECITDNLSDAEMIKVASIAVVSVAMSMDVNGIVWTHSESSDTINQVMKDMGGKLETNPDGSTKLTDQMKNAFGKLFPGLDMGKKD